MKRTILILLTALLSTAPMMAQYSPCYEAAFAEGKRLYNTGQYTQANKYFNEAKGCPDPNEAEVNDMIGKCNKKIKEIKRAEAEKAAFEKCNSVEACEKYLEDYPNGNYVSVVNDKLLKLVKVEKVERESHSKEMNTELISGHAYVDLGLPSGTLWATCNVGASKPEDYGDYFAWGETEPKSTYNWSTYKYANGDYNKLTKYCNDSDLGYNSFTDNLTTLEASDDAATANWGSDWCMPSDDQWIELMDNTSITLTTINRVYGLLFIASNGHSLFLPAAGYRWGDAFNYDGDLGYYWSSSLNTDNSSGTMYFNFNFNSGNYSMKRSYRLDGRSVRAVLRSAPLLREQAVLEAKQHYEKGQRYYENGEWEKALESFMAGASKGNADAQYMLGRMYYSGKGVDRDCKEAVKWYQKAIDQNHADAMAWMSDVYVEKKCGDEVDYDKALSLIRRSIALGSAYGMNNLGYMYLNGYGVTQDYQEAVKWFRKSAEQGNSSGQNSLGYMYQNGYGVEQDYQEAVKWYRKSAEQGNSSGQYDLGYMYQYGEGVEQDYQEAVKWYRKSAEQGNDASIYALRRLGY